MIRSLEINNYRKFDQIKFSNLARINILLGENNVGKTTVLEAVYGFACGDRVMPLIRNSAFGSRIGSENVYEYMESLLSLFHSQDMSPCSFSFSAEFDDDSKQKFEHAFYPNDRILGLMKGIGFVGFCEGEGLKNRSDETLIGRWEIEDRHSSKQIDHIYCPSQASSIVPVGLGRFVDILDHRDQQENSDIYSLLDRNNQLEDLASVVASAFPFIREILATPYPDGSGAQIQFRTSSGGMKPLYNCGDGLQRWFNILGGIMVYPNTIHCIEEVDVALHPEVKKQFVRSLVEFADKYNNQLFIASQSLEFVDCLLDAIYEGGRELDEDDVRIITMLHRPQDVIRTRVLTGGEAYQCRDSFRMDLR